MWSSLPKTFFPVASALVGISIGASRVHPNRLALCEEEYYPIRRHDSRLVKRRSSRQFTDDPRSFVAKSGGDSFENNSESSEESEQYYVNPEKQQNTMILSPPHNSELVAEVCANLGVSLSRSFWGRFADGECSLKVLDEVRGADCFIILPIERDSRAGSNGSHFVNDSIVEMLLMVSALRRASARSITVVLPYVPYARHMEVSPDDSFATPPAGSDLAQLIETSGADRVICVDVHNGMWEGSFSSRVSVNNIDPQGLAVKYFESKRLVNPVIVSPDVIASDRAKSFYKRMKLHGFSCGLATMVSNRQLQEHTARLLGNDRSSGSLSVAPKIKLSQDGQLVLPSGKIVSIASLRTREWLVGDVAGRDCIIVDDMIDSGNRLLTTSQTLKKCGARKIYMFATHGVMSASAMKKIDDSPITEVVVTNTLCPRRDTACEKLRTLSVAGLISETIRRVQMGESVSSLYEKAVLDSADDEDDRNNQ